MIRRRLNFRYTGTAGVGLMITFLRDYVRGSNDGHGGPDGHDGHDGHGDDASILDRHA